MFLLIFLSSFVITASSWPVSINNTVDPEKGQRLFFSNIIRTSKEPPLLSSVSYENFRKIIKACRYSIKYILYVYPYIVSVYPYTDYGRPPTLFGMVHTTWNMVPMKMLMLTLNVIPQLVAALCLIPAVTPWRGILAWREILACWGILTWRKDQKGVDLQRVSPVMTRLASRSPLKYCFQEYFI